MNATGSSEQLVTEESARTPRIAVVVNGRAKNVNRQIISFLDSIVQGGDLFVSRSLQEADEIARVVVTRGYDTVLTGGGDGTFSVMVTRVYREAERQGVEMPRFGFLKLGTGNAIAHVVGAGSSGGVAADIQRLRRDAGSREVALIEVNGQLAPFCGFGMDAMVLRDYENLKQALSSTPLRKLGSGRFGYALSGITRTLPRSLVGKPTVCRILNRGSGPCYRVTQHGLQTEDVRSGGTLFEGPVQLVGAATIPYYGYGFRAFPFAEERPDRFQLRVSNLGPVSFVANFRDIWKGEYFHEDLTDFLVEHVEVEMDRETPFQIGGDYQGEARRMEVALAPRRIRLVDFYSPPSAH